MQKKKRKSEKTKVSVHAGSGVKGGQERELERSKVQQTMAFKTFERKPGVQGLSGDSSLPSTYTGRFVCAAATYAGQEMKTVAMKHGHYRRRMLIMTAFALCDRLWVSWFWLMLA